MALKLPRNFENDIQARDTNLVPHVRIGNWDPTIGWSDPWPIDLGVNDVFGSLPLLLNIPSLKESIDIEKRNYKISNVNIDISNMPYEGLRFSERVESSLSNIECRIYWVSPNTTHATIEGTAPADNTAFQIYVGVIRKYTHDDKMARLVVEDKSQATLHKDLPHPDNYLGVGGDVPDKYKGKPIPMVYGHVDRSPCVIKTELSENDIGDHKIIIDSSSSTITSNEDALFIYNDSYMRVLENAEYTTEDLNYEQLGIYTIYLATWFGYDSNIQYEIITGEGVDYFRIPREFTTTDSEIDSGFGFNPPSNNVIFVEHKAKPSAIRLFVALNNFSNQSNEFSHTHLVEHYYEFFDIGGENPLSMAILDESNLFDLTISRYYPYRISVTFPQPTSLDTSGGWYEYIVTTANLNLTDVLLCHEVGNVANNFPQYGFIKLYYGDVDDIFQQEVLSLDQYIFSDNSSTNMGQYNNTINSNWLRYIEGGQWKDLNIFLTAFVQIDNPSVNLVTDVSLASLSYTNITKYTIFLMDKFIESDFYANVIGRIADAKMYEIIATHDNSIGVAELGIAKATYAGSPDDWTYAFTIDKKINSKKLFEELASASRYIPRFDNMGNFKFDKIPDNGGSRGGYDAIDGTLTTTDSHTIKENDVIDFSFSRTPIEDVYSKVILEYHWDYARGEFSKTQSEWLRDPGNEEGNLDTAGGAWQWNYYFEGADDANGAVLHIDDHRGKYIRDPNTAQKYAKWMLFWHMNQHLKMKVKLPLKYMNLEIGDVIGFDKVLGGVLPYNIDYVSLEEYVNGQKIYPNFMITSTNKTLEFVAIEAVQLHYIDWSLDHEVLEDGDVDNPEQPDIYGCMDSEASNYNPNATIQPEGSCSYDPSGGLFVIGQSTECYLTQIGLQVTPQQLADSMAANGGELSSFKIPYVPLIASWPLGVSHLSAEYNPSLDPSYPWYWEPSSYNTSANQTFGSIFNGLNLINSEYGKIIIDQVDGSPLYQTNLFTSTLQSLTYGGSGYDWNPYEGSGEIFNNFFFPSLIAVQGTDIVEFQQYPWMSSDGYNLYMCANDNMDGKTVPEFCDYIGISHGAFKRVIYADYYDPITDSMPPTSQMSPNGYDTFVPSSQDYWNTGNHGGGYWINSGENINFSRQFMFYTGHFYCIRMADDHTEVLRTDGGSTDTDIPGVDEAFFRNFSAWII